MWKLALVSTMSSSYPILNYYFHVHLNLQTVCTCELYTCTKVFLKTDEIVYYFYKKYRWSAWVDTCINIYIGWSTSTDDLRETQLTTVLYLSVGNVLNRLCEQTWWTGWRRHRTIRCRGLVTLGNQISLGHIVFIINIQPGYITHDQNR